MMRICPPQSGHGSRSVSGVISAAGGPCSCVALCAEQGANLCYIGLAGGAGEQAIVTDAVEPSGSTWMRKRRMNSDVQGA